MTATGVPGFINNAREQRQTRAFVEVEFKRLDQRLDVLSDDMKKLVESLPDRIIQQLVETIRIEGVQPVTLSSIKDLILSILQSEDGPMYSFGAELRLISERLNRSGAMGDTGNADGSSDAQTKSTNKFESFTWSDGNSFHRVPEGFCWPKGINTRTIWDLWFLGNVQLKICRYSVIDPKFELAAKACRERQSKAKKVMDKMIKILIEDSEISSQKEINETNVQLMFDYSYNKLIREIYGQEIPRPGDLGVTTVYQRLVDYNKANE
jgi:hypothetical protein